MGQQYDEEAVRRQLRRKAYAMRQEAIRDGNYETWRMARFIRNVASHSSSEAERKLDRFWERISR